MSITVSDYIAELEDDISRHEAFLEPFAAGRAFVSSREGNGPSSDVTQDIIAEGRRTIGILKKIVAALKEGKLK
jgi:hypothetical protein